MFNRKLLVALIAAGAVSGVYAQIPVQAPEVPVLSPAEEIARLNEEIAVKSARLKALELEAQLAAKQSELDRASAQSNGGASNDQSLALPVVRAIEGADGRLKAILALGGGVLQPVYQGEKIRGGWTVAQISVNAVTLARGRERVRLGFGSEPPASVGPAAQGGVQIPGQAY